MPSVLQQDSDIVTMSDLNKAMNVSTTPEFPNYEIDESRKSHSDRNTPAHTLNRHAMSDQHMVNQSEIDRSDESILNPQNPHRATYPITGRPTGESNLFPGQTIAKRVVDSRKVEIGFLGQITTQKFDTVPTYGSEDFSSDEYVEGTQYEDDERRQCDESERNYDNTRDVRQRPDDVSVIESVCVGDSVRVYGGVVAKGGSGTPEEDSRIGMHNTGDVDSALVEADSAVQNSATVEGDSAVIDSSSRKSDSVSITERKSNSDDSSSVLMGSLRVPPLSQSLMGSALVVDVFRTPSKEFNGFSRLKTPPVVASIVNTFKQMNFQQRIENAVQELHDKAIDTASEQSQSFEGTVTQEESVVPARKDPYRGRIHQEHQHLRNSHQIGRGAKQEDPQLSRQESCLETHELTTSVQESLVQQRLTEVGQELRAIWRHGGHGPGQGPGQQQSRETRMPGRQQVPQEKQQQLPEQNPKLPQQNPQLSRRQAPMAYGTISQNLSQIASPTEEEIRAPPSPCGLFEEPMQEDIVDVPAVSRSKENLVPNPFHSGGNDRIQVKTVFKSGFDDSEVYANDVDLMHTGSLSNLVPEDALRDGPEDELIGPSMLGRDPPNQRGLQPGRQQKPGRVNPTANRRFDDVIWHDGHTHASEHMASRNSESNIFCTPERRAKSNGRVSRLSKSPVPTARECQQQRKTLATYQGLGNPSAAEQRGSAPGIRALSPRPFVPSSRIMKPFGELEGARRAAVTAPNSATKVTPAKMTPRTTTRASLGQRVGVGIPHGGGTLSEKLYLDAQKRNERREQLQQEKKYREEQAYRDMKMEHKIEQQKLKKEREKLRKTVYGKAKFMSCISPSDANLETAEGTTNTGSATALGSRSANKCEDQNGEDAKFAAFLKREKLFEQRRQKKREALTQKIQKERTEKEMKECSFRPELNTTSPFVRSNVGSKTHSGASIYGSEFDIPTIEDFCYSGPGSKSPKNSTGATPATMSAVTPRGEAAPSPVSAPEAEASCAALVSSLLTATNLTSGTLSPARKTAPGSDAVLGSGLLTSKQVEPFARPASSCKQEKTVESLIGAARNSIASTNLSTTAGKTSTPAEVSKTDASKCNPCADSKKAYEASAAKLQELKKDAAKAAEEQESRLRSDKDILKALGLLKTDSSPTVLSIRNGSIVGL